VSGFSAEWLDLREPFDALARAASLVTELKRHVVAGTNAAPLAIVGLGPAQARTCASRHGWRRATPGADHDPDCSRRR
jgi:hypothetical protein